MTLAADITEAIVQLGELRSAAQAAPELSEQARRFLLERLDRAMGELSHAAMTASDGKPPTPLVLAIQRAERDGDDETVEALLRQADNDARVLRGDGFTVVPAAKNA